MLCSLGLGLCHKKLFLSLLKRNRKEWYWPVIFDGHLLGPTFIAGTLQPDAGLNPQLAAWPENLKETKLASIVFGVALAAYYCVPGRVVPFVVVCFLSLSFLTSLKRKRQLYFRLKRFLDLNGSVLHSFAVLCWSPHSTSYHCRYFRCTFRQLGYLQLSYPGINSITIVVLRYMTATAVVI
jgi:hypothetical protein